MKTFLALMTTLFLAGVGSFGGCFIGISAAQGSGDYGINGAVLGALIGGVVGFVAGLALFSRFRRPRPPS